MAFRSSWLVLELFGLSDISPFSSRFLANGVKGLIQLRLCYRNVKEVAGSDGSFNPKHACVERKMHLTSYTF